MLTNDELIRCGKYWIDELKLSNWNIKIRFGAKRKDFSCAGRLGEVAINSMMRLANIDIITDPDELTDDERASCLDPEQTLVHELLHIKLCFVEQALEKDVVASSLLHQFIEDTARTLIDVARELDKVKDLNVGGVVDED